MQSTTFPSSRARARTLSLAALAATAAMLAGHAQAAPLANGQFSQGLQGWQTAGDASVQVAPLWQIDIGPAPRLVLGTATTWTDDDAPLAAGAFNASGIDPSAAGDASGLEASLGLPTTALGFDAYEGSSAWQTFDVQAGQRIGFTWRIATRDNGTRADEPDGAWLLTRQGGQDSLTQLGQIAGLAMQATAGGWLDSGEMQATFIATQSGPLTLGWAIADVGSFSNTSLLLIGDVTVTNVPEPTTIALVVAGLAALRAGRRRSGRKDCSNQCV